MNTFNDIHIHTLLMRMYFSRQYKYIHNKFIINFNVRVYEYFGIFAATANKTQLLNTSSCTIFIINENNIPKRKNKFKYTVFKSV